MIITNIGMKSMYLWITNPSLQLHKLPSQQHCTAIISAVCTCTGVDKAKPVSYSYANSFVIGISERCWLDHSNQAPTFVYSTTFVYRHNRICIISLY